MEPHGSESLTNAVDRIRGEVYLEQRSVSDRAETIGTAAIAIFAPVSLWDHLPHTLLVIWGGLLLLGTAGWTSKVIPPNATRLLFRSIRATWVWGSSILWGALPWLSPSALDDSTVAWTMAFVCIYGVASDVVFVPLTSSTSLNRILAGYASSYVIALALAEQWLVTCAVAGSVALLLIGSRGLQRLVQNLIDQRVKGEQRALIDALTGVGTRVAASNWIEDLRADDSVQLIHCLFCDIDDFKQLNDTYGYDTGDDALRATAQSLAAKLPDRWSVARFGGDEFVAIGPDPVDLTGFFDIELNLRPEFGGGTQLQAMSIGATALPATDATPAALFREAGAALRRAKQAGKHTAVIMDDDLRAVEADRARLGGRIGSAIEAAEFIAYAQPIVEMSTTATVGVELLARWPQGDGTISMPGSFVPIIEEQGRGPQLGRLMIGHAVDLLSELRTRGSDVYVTVNLSARHLYHRQLPEEIRVLLHNAGISPSRLVLEVTESQYLPSSAVWQTTAEQIRAIGVGLAIDDFGTGYSTMEQLLKLPFSHVKLDRIVASSMTRPGAAELAAAVCSMAEGAGMVGIAEGIETEAERRVMMSAGYRYGQGYFFARPMPLPDFLATLAPQAATSH